MTTALRADTAALLKGSDQLTAAYIAAAAAAVIAFILLLPLRAELSFSYNAEGLQYSLIFKALGIRLRRLRARRKRERQENTEKKQERKKPRITPAQAVMFLYDNRDIIKRTVSRTADYAAKHLVKIKLLKLHAIIGLDDAMDTALIYGCSAAVIYNAAAAAQRRLRLVRHDISVKPDFNDPRISADIEAIITTNIFHMAVIGIIGARNGYPLLGKFKDMISGADAEGGE